MRDPVMPDLIPCPMCMGSARRLSEHRGLHKYVCIAGHATLRTPESMRMTERIMADLYPDGPGPGPTVA